MEPEDLLQQQDLVLTRAQALAHGLTKHAWDWRIAHSWQSVVDGVAVAHTGGLTSRQRLWAAVLYAGKGALLSGDAVLHLLGVPFEATAPIDVAIPHERRVQTTTLRDDTEIRIHRVRRLELLTSSVVGLPSVSRHTAVLHAAAWAPSDRAAEWRIATTVQRRVTTPELLRQARIDLPKIPRRALIGAVLDDVELGAHAASELEFLRFLRRHRLPTPDALQQRVRAGGAMSYLDARYRRQRVSFEIDGAHHREASQWDADALRTLRIAAVLPGERIYRLTLANLRHDGAAVAAVLRTLLCEARPGLGGSHPGLAG